MTPEFLDHCAHPRHAGDLPNANGAASRENPACGDVARVEVRVIDGVVEAMGFRVEGCPASIACLSALAETVHGRPVAEVTSLGPDAVEAVLGPLPAGRRHALDLAFETLRAAVGEAAERVA